MHTVITKAHFAFIKCGGWAVVLVFCLHRGVMLAGVREAADALMHGVGGMAICYVCFRVSGEAQAWFGALSLAMRTWLGFSGGCTAALLWELGEFASDSILGTHVQKSLSETMLDLAHGTLGVATVAGLLFGVNWKKRAVP